MGTRPSYYPEEEVSLESGRMTSVVGAAAPLLSVSRKPKKILLRHHERPTCELPAVFALCHKIFLRIPGRKDISSDASDAAMFTNSHFIFPPNRQMGQGEARED